ncbi:MAG: beta-lactamase family protein [Acidobacteria bacterium]|nr:beta-lactamase family protein [Acidobacteriota bacterium]
MPRRLAAAVLLIAAATANAAGPTIRRIDGSKISIPEADALARRVLNENHVTGAQIAIVNDGQLVWISAYGYADLGLRLRMTPETPTWAASITKPIFATYVMQLAGQGVINLDTPLAQLLPRPLDSYPAYKDTASELVRDPRFATVTPRMLLSHTSGLANFASDEPDNKMHLHFTPGSRYAYSGQGLNLLQFAVELRMERPLEYLMKAAIFDPLNMTRSFMVWNGTVFNYAAADRYDAGEKLISHTQRTPARAAGSLVTTANDLAIFVANLFSKPKTGTALRITRDLTGMSAQNNNDAPVTPALLRPESFKTMLTPVVQIDTLHQFPTFDEAKGTEAPAVGLAYGLGWGLLTKTKFGPAFFKEGHGDGAQNYMVCFTRHKDCMIILTNSDNGELAFQPLLEGILGDTVTPWKWELYDRESIMASREKK